MKYLGHKSEDGREQLLLEHLQGTAALCGQFAAAFGMEKIGYALGLYHDVGKYSAGFQKRIQNDGRKVDHASAGAQLVKNIAASFCIAGHHSGLMNLGSKAFVNEGTLYGRMKKQLTDELDYQNYLQELSPCNEKIFDSLRSFCGKDIYRTMFLTRMLFSCLVDADFIDTERFMSAGRITRGDFDAFADIYKRFQEYIKKFNPCTSPINGKRCEILNTCLSAGKGKEGLYSLTVPTGGGKTIASLGFSLEHVMAWPNLKRRIIYVIPYTSIIEQTAEVFREIVGVKNVVEHHMNVDYDSDEYSMEQVEERHKLAVENWDAPIIVTTNVQFFESLYGRKSSRCRKLHNIADSVVVFDEAQMLPNDYLKPCVKAIEELVVKYHVTAVLCTATQPSLNKFFSPAVECKEICSDIEGLYKFFQRVQYQQSDFESIEALAENINSQRQALCIVNSKRNAQKLFDKLTGVNKFHLSTFMCSAHRRKILHSIRKCLDAKEPCKVVATSLIEAGVDVDFPVVYREIAGLDSIIQAGGRCNRNNRNPLEASFVKVFTLVQNDRGIPDFVKLPQEITRMICQRHEDMASIAAIKEYFNKLHDYKGEGIDIKRILAQSDNTALPFKDIAEDFKLIEETGRNVFIPLDQEALAIADKLRQGIRNRNLLRRAGQYMVTVYENQYKSLAGQGVLEQIDANIDILLALEKYSEDKGLNTDVEEGVGVFI